VSEADFRKRQLFEVRRPAAALTSSRSDGMSLAQPFKGWDNRAADYFMVA
jgi:hypothetical protein